MLYRGPKKGNIGSVLERNRKQNGLNLGPSSVQVTHLLLEECTSLERKSNKVTAGQYTVKHDFTVFIVYSIGAHITQWLGTEQAQSLLNLLETQPIYIFALLTFQES